MITFVSSLLHATKEDNDNMDNIINLFFKMTKHLNIVLFISAKYKESIENWIMKEMNEQHLTEISRKIKIVVRELEETDIYGNCQKLGDVHAIKLPHVRNADKDTYEFIVNGHTKHELMETTIRLNPWDTSHFAWLDFNIASLFRDFDNTVGFLNMLNNHPLSANFLAIPGCHKKTENLTIDTITTGVHWRFCGGHFIGDKQSVKTFCETHREQFAIFLKNNKQLTWDFNFWAWMEHNNNVLINWFQSGHDDSIVFCSAQHYAIPLHPLGEKTVYHYPSICDLLGEYNKQDEELQHYTPTSASYISRKGEHWLNTRYVNYRIHDNGSYFMPNVERIIKNKNVLSRLNDDFQPVSFRLVKETIDISIDAQTMSQGLEDVRLYADEKGGVKYVATTINYTSNKIAKIICGEYDLNNACIMNGAVLQSPNGNHERWEKNWIPLILEGEELFIYKWNPLQIGRIQPDTNELSIVHEHAINNKLFDVIKGSSTFVETEEGLLGVVHFSEKNESFECNILYLHMLVLLNKNTLQPIKHSVAFYFDKLGIEYCIGFTVQPSPINEHNNNNNNNNNKYVFWISRHDREPLRMSINANDFTWLCV